MVQKGQLHHKKGFVDRTMILHLDPNINRTFFSIKIKKKKNNNKKREVNCVYIENEMDFKPVFMHYAHFFIPDAALFVC